jgi:hypothetical protein
MSKCNECGFNTDFRHRHGCAAPRTEEDRLRAEVASLKTSLSLLQGEVFRAIQFCTWLSKDSAKYAGTDAGAVAGRMLVDLRRAYDAQKDSPNE